MSCDQVRAVIKLRRRRDCPLSVGPHGAQLYGRYVRDALFCATSELPEIVYITAADTRLCLVWECKYYDLDDDFLVVR